jgi:cation diffusion facilitator CzcD-associated flavoprotein CzcO
MNMTSQQPLDVAIVGGGIAGVVHLHYARLAGLSALVLEKNDGVGGLWRELPAWQDIQISPTDWGLGDLPLAGATQPQILANIEAWVDRFALANGIRLDSPVCHPRAQCRRRLGAADTLGGRVRTPSGGGHRRTQQRADPADPSRRTQGAHSP